MKKKQQQQKKNNNFTFDFVKLVHFCKLIYLYFWEKYY